MERKYEVNIKELDGEYSDGRNILTITHDGQEIEDYVDGGEPEDNSFHRSYYWITRELRRAYEFGLQDGKNGK